jgi:hypothetical protein
MGKEMLKNKELRMMGLVPYNLSDIQKGIQFGHAVVEYSQMIKKSNKITHINRYEDWADNWKTFIILNGGTSNHSVNRYQPNEEFIGSMETNLETLKKAGIPVGVFYEPDLNDMLSGIVFVVQEEVFNKKDYPDFEDWVIENYGGLLKVDTDNQSYAESSKQLSMMIKYSEDEHDQKIYNKWVDFVGGSSNAFMKEFLINFSLA